VPPLDSLLAFAVAAFVLIVIPGPSVLFVVGRGVALGRRAALWSVLGNEAGLAVLVVAVAMGLGAVVERSLVVFTVLKLAGAAYLVHLGIKAIRDRRAWRAAIGAMSVPKGSRRLVAEGFLVGVGNPKVIVFLAAILPQFVATDGPPPGVQMFVLGLVFVGIALACDSMWALAAGTARDALAGSPRRMDRMGVAGGVVMIGLGMRLALAGRPD
jgi:threonine/homoserine/homoserine lactone efflux protein